MAKKALGIGLLSGGLDSALAAAVTRDAGADVICLHFFTGFCVTGHHSRVGKTDKPIANTALQVAAELGVQLELCDVSQEYLDIVLHPRYGYGANMNPCIDCRIFMLRKAGEFMEQHGADFVFTGEVIGQRPMSQMRDTLALIEKNAELEGRLLRPLSARLLAPTIPEREGLVERRKLYDFHGRSRKPQLELARKYGLKSFSQPAGGCCFLTDETYSRRFRDLIAAKGEEKLDLDDIFILGVGRHFRIGPSVKLIIGRDERENNFLERYAQTRWTARVVGFPGPLALVDGEMDEAKIPLIASMVARYSDAKQMGAVQVELRRGDEARTLTVPPAGDELLTKFRV